VSAGEALSSDLSTAFLARSTAVLHNFYGPTESSIDAAYWTCRHSPHSRGVEPIGRAIPGMKIYVLGRHMQLVPVGVPGELYIGGIGLARGYLGRPDTTAERFLPDPFSARPGARLYRTGDHGRLKSDGVLEFVGRDEEIVKIRGVRIEVGEIEAELKRHAAVREAVVVARFGPSDRGQLDRALPEVNRAHDDADRP
jgi:non-ribosomal peptide synthetase component F